MKKTIGFTFLLIMMAGLLLVGLGCGTMTSLTSKTNVDISFQRYKPGFSAERFQAYKDVTIYMPSFTNRAENTHRYNYYSPDKKISYVSEYALDSYFWYCFERAFTHIGARVQEPASMFTEPLAPPGIAEFRLLLISLTDEEFQFEAGVYRDRVLKIQKEFAVTMPPAASTDPAVLEKRAYDLVDKAFTTILADPEINDHLL